MLIMLTPRDCGTVSFGAILRTNWSCRKIRAREVRYCDVQGGFAGLGASHIINDNPDFVGASDYHLQGVSPCIDTGSNNYGITDDLEGRTRPLDGDGDSVATCDNGSV